ncbi:hypothetical protein M9H77_25562 [Catharanthus roseus]|uniref:Uncharacterized protein n=1 Tax=Catharanthus roseus TaxID=4058 RepID=A0ACC0A7H0_CATRO|nr:hypothetical protein M9H77_25562 [Catharanthus roseus]
MFVSDSRYHIVAVHDAGMQRSIGKERATVLPKESPLILWSGNRPRKDATRSTLMLVILLKDQPKVILALNADDSHMPVAEH